MHGHEAQSFWARAPAVHRCRRRAWRRHGPAVPTPLMQTPCSSNMNPLVSKLHGSEKRWSAEFGALRQLCFATGLNEELKWGQACYDIDGRNIVLIHGFKHYCALLFIKGALLKDPDDILVHQTKNVQTVRQIHSLIRRASAREANPSNVI